MKSLLAVVLSLAFALASSLPRADELVPELGGPIVGTVLDVQQVEHYTYLLLRTNAGEIWAAVTTAAVVKGSQVTITNYSEMDGFESPTLHRTFDRIVFGQLANDTVVVDPHRPSAPTGAMAAARGGTHGDMPGHGADPHGIAAMHAAADRADDAAPISVAKPEGPDGRTISQVVAGAAALKDTPVTIRGQIVRFTSDVMGRNWEHLRDGSGAAADGTNDILVVTRSEAKVGEIVLANGIVRTDRDFGSGYSYRVLIDEATLQR